MLKPIMTCLAALAFVTQVAPQTAMAQSASQATAPTPSQHATWSALLGKYVKPSADGLNRFDYAGLKANATDSAALDAYIASFAALDVGALPRNQQYVTWINIYNARTIQYIRDQYPTKTIKDSLFGPWKKIFTTVNGTQISLNDIEHEVLRKQWSEPRTHYAVNCASYGCPNLKTSAWEVATLDADLTKAAQDFINHPRGVTVRSDGKLQVSTIYKWFKEDFGTSEANVIAHLRTYANPELQAQIDARPDIKNYEYDWSLNGTN